MVVPSGDVDPVVGSDGDPVGQAELPWTRAAIAEVQQQLPRRVKDLDVVKDRVRDIDMPERIRRHALGPAEMTGRIATAADRSDEFAIGGEGLDAAVQRIGDEQVTASVRADM